MNQGFLVQLANMGCGCENELTEDQRFGVPQDAPCDSISIGLLEMYKNPIDCYLKNKLWSQIGSTSEEMQAASDYLAGLIAQKTADPENCEGVQNLLNVRKMMHLILNKGICL